MTGAGTRRRWWWLQGRVIAGDPLLLGGGRGRLQGMILGQLNGRNIETGNSRRKGKKRAPRNGVIMGCKRGAP